MDKQGILEGLLFVSGSDGITLAKLEEVLELKQEEVLKLIDDLKEVYSSSKHGIDIQYLGNTYKLTTKSEHKDFYKQLVLDENSNLLGQSALETLAIIAYNEPITRGHINEIRGVDSSYIIRKLVLKKLVEEAGRSDLPGRPMLYKTTDQFLDYFGLKSKDDLPKLEATDETDEEIELFNSKYSEIL